MEREAARVIVFSPVGDVLLQEMQSYAGRCWIVPGGGLAPGESHEEAAIRELAGGSLSVGCQKVHSNSAVSLSDHYDQAPSMLLFVLDACLRLLIDLALARFSRWPR